MGAKSDIQWTDATWSPIRARVKSDAPQIAMLHGWKDLAEICERMKGHVGPHCEMCSPGCNHCYSLTNNGRCLPANGTGLPFDKRSRELVDIFIDEKILMQPSKWRQPRKIFVENQSDLFGEWVRDTAIADVFAVMAMAPQHTFQVLTKRADRMAEWMTSGAGWMTAALNFRDRELGGFAYPWPLPNVWLGVSAEDQKRADERIPLLLQTPAAVRFVSYEPALGPIDFHGIRHPLKHPKSQIDSKLRVFDPVLEPRLHWVIVGGESGSGARPFNINWARDVVEQCKAANVAVFVKQFGARPFWTGMNWPRVNYHRPEEVVQGNTGWFVRLKDRKGGNPEEWPEDLRVRQSRPFSPASTI